MARAVLIIDDEETLARNLAVYLERLGYEVRTAGSAEDGLMQHAEFKPDVVDLPGHISELETTRAWLDGVTFQDLIAQ